MSIKISIFERNSVTVRQKTPAISTVFKFKGKMNSVISSKIKEPARQKMIVVRTRYLILSFALIGRALVSQKACPSLVMAVAEILQITAGEISKPLNIRSR